jgi:peptidoglycan/xylan/chitin deacetylase (PgdA/CDA1 family)
MVVPMTSLYHSGHLQLAYPYPIFLYHALWPPLGSDVAIESYLASDPQLMDPGSRHYAMDQDVFRKQMTCIGHMGLKTPRQWMDLESLHDAPSACISFDDGHLSNLSLALPVLQSLDLHAIFFITTDWINRAGFMDEDHLREIIKAGMLVGSHGCSHRYFSDLQVDELRHEMQGSKSRLEQVLNEEVPAIALPGGRDHPELRKIAREIGYRYVFTSRIDLAGPESDLMNLPRIPITQNQPALFLSDLLDGKREDIWKMKKRSERTRKLKKLLGNRLYDRFRDFIMRSKR